MASFRSSLKSIRRLLTVLFRSIWRKKRLSTCSQSVHEPFSEVIYAGTDVESKKKELVRKREKPISMHRSQISNGLFKVNGFHCHHAKEIHTYSVKYNEKEFKVLPVIEMYANAILGHKRNKL